MNDTCSTTFSMPRVATGDRQHHSISQAEDSSQTSGSECQTETNRRPARECGIGTSAGVSIQRYSYYG